MSRRGWEDQVWRQCVIMKVEARVMRAHELRNVAALEAERAGNVEPSGIP